MFSNKGIWEFNNTWRNISKTYSQESKVTINKKAKTWFSKIIIISQAEKKN